VGNSGTEGEGGGCCDGGVKGDKVELVNGSEESGVSGGLVGVGNTDCEGNEVEVVVGNGDGLED
jgi:hypothetical protein